MKRSFKSAGDSVSTPASVEPTGSASGAPIAALACTQVRDWAAEMEPILIRVESFIDLIEKTQDYDFSNVLAVSRAVEHQDALVWGLRAEVQRLSNLQDEIYAVADARHAGAVFTEIQRRSARDHSNAAAEIDHD